MSKLQWCIFLIFLSPLLMSQDVSCARILVVLPTVVKSHFTMMESYLKTLAARGHQVVVLSHFPQKEPVPNYKDIVVDGDMKNFGRGRGIDINMVLENENPVVNVRNLHKFGVDTCESVFSQPNVQKLIKSNEKFDVVINDLFHTDCFLAFAHKFKAISIGISTSVLMPWSNERMGNPDNPSYIPNLFSPYSDRMNFFERMLNFLGTYAYQYTYKLFVNRPANEVVKKYFGEDTPDVEDIAKNTSLVLVNSYFSLNSPRPFVPSIIEVGGIHISAPKDIPKHLQDYLDGADHGAIYFSLGSMIQAESFPDEKRDAFLQAFAELPQRVLWKWESDNLPGQPKNVKTEKWCPQLDILRHPRIAAFISHGGLLGSLEATYTGVPVIGIPFFGDQRTNLKNLQVRGMGVVLEYHNITKESVLEALRTVLDNTSYIENARKQARIFRDRPLSAMDKAIFWTEYVIRHGGAPHLRSAAVDLPLFQYLLLDIISLLLVIVILVTTILAFFTKKLFAVIFGSKSVPTPCQANKKKKKQ